MDKLNKKDYKLLLEKAPALLLFIAFYLGRDYERLYNKLGIGNFIDFDALKHAASCGADISIKNLDINNLHFLCPDKAKIEEFNKISYQFQEIISATE